MPLDDHPIASSAVTGASSGIGLKLAHVPAEHRSDLLIDATFLISDRPLENAPIGCKDFRDKQNEWTNVVLRP